MILNDMDGIVQSFAFLPPEILVGLLATLPLTELRAALPIGLTVFELPPVVAYSSAVVGNLVPLGLVWGLLPTLIRFARSKSPWLTRVLDRYFAALERKHHTAFQRYGSLALLMFVAVPLPGSGVWTGSVLSVLFQLERRRAVLAIIAGLLCSGILVFAITQGVIGGLSFLL